MTTTTQRSLYMLAEGGLEGVREDFLATGLHAARTTLRSTIEKKGLAWSETRALEHVLRIWFRRQCDPDVKAAVAMEAGKIKTRHEGLESHRVEQGPTVSAIAARYGLAITLHRLPSPDWAYPSLRVGDHLLWVVTELGTGATSAHVLDVPVDRVAVHQCRALEHLTGCFGEVFATRPEIPYRRELDLHFEGRLWKRFFTEDSAIATMLGHFCAPYRQGTPGWPDLSEHVRRSVHEIEFEGQAAYVSIETTIGSPGSGHWRNYTNVSLIDKADYDAVLDTENTDARFGDRDPEDRLVEWE